MLGLRRRVRDQLELAPIIRRGCPRTRSPRSRSGSHVRRATVESLGLAKRTIARRIQQKQTLTSEDPSASCGSRASSRRPRRSSVVSRRRAGGCRNPTARSAARSPFACSTRTSARTRCSKSSVASTTESLVKLVFWRICRSVRAKTAFDGEGPTLPRSVEPQGRAVGLLRLVLSLSTLEYFVHLDPEDMPDDLVAIRAELPRVAAEEIHPTKLPKSWRKVPGPPPLRRLGSEWVAKGRSVALRVPSAVIPDEHNSCSTRATPTWRRS